jgi:hypothetical protein
MRYVAGFVAAVALLSGAAGADTVRAIDFIAATQSFWGPGGSANDLDEGGRTPGAVGFGFDVDASTGTVRGDYGGQLAFFFPDVYFVSDGPLAIGTSFSGGNGFLTTRLGAQMDVFGFVDVVIPVPLAPDIPVDIEVSIPPFPLGNFLDGSRNFGLGLGGQTSVTAVTNFDINAFAAAGGLVEFGPTFKVTQTSTFRPTAIGGTLVYTHRDTGLSFSTPFNAGQAPAIQFPLLGIWDFSVENLVLANVFATGFDGAVGGYVDIFILGRSEITTANFNLHDVSPFGLSFSTVDIPNAFSINAVPEPSSLALLGAAAGALLVWRRRRARGR